MEKIEWYKDSSRIHYVALNLRPGALLFSNLLEYIYFHPKEDPMENTVFHCEPVTWMEMLWYITTIPKEHIPKAEEIAEKLFLRISDGVPTILGGEQRAVQFPMNFPNVWTIENKGGGPKRMYFAPDDPLLKNELALVDIVSHRSSKEARTIMDEYNRVKGDISQIGKESNETDTN